MKYPHLISPIIFKKNKGKGAAIRAGWEEYNSFKWLAFVDADGSIPPQDAFDFIQTVIEKNDNFSSCTVRPSLSTQSRSIKRQISVFSFSTIANVVLGLKLQDPQCGFKAIPTFAYSNIVNELRFNRFAFDCELLAF